MVRPGEIEAVVSDAAAGLGAGDGAGRTLRRPRLLSAGQAARPDGAALKRRIVERARAHGFDVVRIANVDDIPEAGPRLAAWLGAGHHASMAWMAQTADRRRHPRAMWPQARSAIVLGANYSPDVNPLDNLSRRERATISVYAQRRDYHDVLKGRLKQVAGAIASAGGIEVKVFVDTAPLMEKPLAAAAGLGWQGKHTVLVSRDFGNWLFLGVILTDAVLPADVPAQDSCGSCRRCLDVCPTDAFPAPYQLDARRCISYLTIEHDGPIDRQFRAAMGNRVFGCDDCLAVCPWNKFAQAASDAKMAARSELESPALAELLALDDATFRIRFAGTPVKRTGRDRFVRNVLIAAGNSAEPRLVTAVGRLLDDPAPVVRGAAAWAYAQLAPAAARAEAARRLSADEDGSVKAEWQAILAEPSPGTTGPLSMDRA